MRSGFVRFSWNVFSVKSRMMSSAHVVAQLSFDEYDAYGFDIDHTLAKYNIPHLFTDSYTAIANYLVKKRGYSSDILSFDKDFFARGLVLDVEKGNFMKLAEDGTVLRASHGTKRLTEEELCAAYGTNKHWSHFEKLIANVDNIDKFWIFENFFDMPVGAVCARIIDSVDAHAGRPSQVYNYWDDVREATDHVYNPKHFAADEGEFFPKWKQDTGRFVEPLSANVKSWLKKLKQQGNKKLFVLSSSYADFAAASLEFIFGDDWEDYFDLYLTLAKKPSFFTSNRPFRQLGESASKYGAPVSELKERQFYVHGNSSTLVSYLAKVTGKEKPKVLFFGDSLRSDVSSTKRFVNWDTVLVLEELEAECGSILGLDKAQGFEPSPKRQRLSTSCEMERAFLSSRQWGSLFTDDHLAVCGDVTGEKRNMNTLWGYVIRKYANIAIPQLKYVADMPLNHKFQVFNPEESFTWGFYPRLPQSLRLNTL